uniref:BTB domain-containing protein n=1 Tax=Panagrolaimus davidi TaxID=227884 RepID=A0A914PRW0_9BILA
MQPRFFTANKQLTDRIQYRFCYLKDVLNPENKFIENDKFTIQMKGMMFFESSPKDREKPSLTLAQYLWERDDDRDFIILVGKSNELKTEVKIHRCVFASRSPVFDRMLETEMKEKAENKLEIIDFSPDIVKLAAEHFYDRETYKTSNVDQLIDLLQFAQKYDIQDLKSKVEHILIIKVRPNNICQISNASINANSTKLKEVCIQLMRFYMNQKLPFNEEITLNEDFVIELNQTTAFPVEEKEEE